jgi:hypothetical protein
MNRSLIRPLHLQALGSQRPWPGRDRPSAARSVTMSPQWTLGERRGRAVRTDDRRRPFGPVAGGGARPRAHMRTQRRQVLQRTESPDADTVSPSAVTGHLSSPRGAGPRYARAPSSRCPTALCCWVRIFSSTTGASTSGNEHFEVEKKKVALGFLALNAMAKPR